ncbi:acyltransferase family protein [Nocardioides dongkuii]|uniref:acyltransferase family protein n=1 Tax=Nocardioides dongkuii TaxID=2760089 RepID=UPI001878AD8B|nr:acyltransferase family protein [Nocardioides dongkuii]
MTLPRWWPELPERTRKVRWDIQGLRAFAVLAVVLDHLTEWPGGGFLGVDIFFVISGFLITGLLLREHEKTGHISFLGFYARRAKRILPASLLVIAATVLVGWGILTKTQTRDLTVDAVWALLFSANWRFGLQETDYFNLDRAISPLQHYWSLGVEEQFYFVWPWLIVLTFAVFARHSIARLAVGVVMTTIVFASFTYAIFLTGADADFAYFSTLTRVWELGVGAVLAVAVPHLTRLPDHVRPILAWLGLAGMTTSIFVIDAADGFPAPEAALPVLSTALVIAAGTYADHRQQQPWLAPLTNRISHYVGDISYSLYLWHFPVIILFGTWYGEPDAVYYIVSVAAMAALSVFSYHAIEEPARNITWFNTRMRRRDRAAFDWQPARNTTLILLATATAILVAAASTVGGEIEQTETAREIEQLQEQAQDEQSQAALSPLMRAHQGRILRALSASTFPEFKPEVDSLSTQQWIDSLTSDGVGCADVDESNLADCTFGPALAPRTAVLLGDSYGMAWMPAVRAALEPRYRVLQMTRGECPAWGIPMLREGKPFPECDQQIEWALREIATLKPNLVIVAQSDIGLSRVANGESPTTAVRDGLARVLSRLKGPAGRTFVLASPPGSQPLQDCVKRLGSPDDCVSTVSDQWHAVHAAELAATELAGVGYIDSRDWFCAFDRCPGWLDTVPIRADGGHITLEFARTLGPLLREAVVQ